MPLLIPAVAPATPIQVISIDDITQTVSRAIEGTMCGRYDLVHPQVLTLGEILTRLRAWLGSDSDGEPYLPDAYSGRIRLDPAVSSDWHQLRLLVGDGVDRASSSVLELGLRLVRGAPLADAAPVQWHWAEELRTDIVSCVRDIGVELARRCIDDHDLDLARWSAARALVAAPGDELLMAARIRTEHLAGNAAETERLSLQLARQARSLGVDLEPETVDLIQEVMEGRVRARLA